VRITLDPEEYKRRLRAQEAETGEAGPPDPGNPTVNFRGERRSNATHRSATDPDCRFVSKGSSGTGAYPGYTVNALMENRHRLLLGLNVEIFQGTASEKAGCLALLDRAQRRLGFAPLTLGADKGFFHEPFIEALLARDIVPHIATEARGSSTAHACISRLSLWRVGSSLDLKRAHNPLYWGSKPSTRPSKVARLRRALGF